MTNQVLQTPSKRHYESLAVLEFIAHYQQQNEGHSTSHRPIQRDLQINASLGVHAILHRLSQWFTNR